MPSKVKPSKVKFWRKDTYVEFNVLKVYMLGRLKMADFDPMDF